MVVCLALIPGLVVEVYLGYAGKYVARMAGRPGGAVHVHDVTVLGGLAITIIVLVVVSRTARKALMQAVAAPAEADA